MVAKRGGEGRPKTAIRELIIQNHHLTYRETEASLGNTSLHSILHPHLAVKKICSRRIPHNLTIVQKKVRADWCKKLLEKYNGGV